MTWYRPAPDVEGIARQLIPPYHPHLGECQLVYLFVDPPPAVKGRMQWGKASVVTGRAAYLLALPGFAPDEAPRPREGAEVSLFVVEVAELVWAHLSTRERRALVDHELSHCFTFVNTAGQTRLAIRGHDIEEFQQVVARHGMWRPDLVDFAGVVEQLTLADHWNEGVEVRT